MSKKYLLIGMSPNVGQYTETGKYAQLMGEAEELDFIPIIVSGVATGEVQAYNARRNRVAPFIAENGSITGYPNESGEFSLERQGRTREELTTIIQGTLKQENLEGELKLITDFSPKELSKLCGIGVDSALLAQQRLASQVVIGPTIKEMANMKHYEVVKGPIDLSVKPWYEPLVDEGLNFHFGTRYLSLNTATKADAVNTLVGRLKQQHGDIIVYAVGCAGRDTAWVNKFKNHYVMNWNDPAPIIRDGVLTRRDANEPGNMYDLGVAAERKQRENH